ncbi:hypothetical protein PVAP13_4NG202822, partial [Panicum virgatum]
LPGVHLWPQDSHWYYTEEQIKEFESGKEKWPCEWAPRPRCKCGILARRGVVPTELGYGWYCGNPFGLFWEGRTCDWETFPGREDLRIKLARYAEPYRTRRTLEKKVKIRHKYKVHLPDERILFGPVAVDLVAKHGNSGKLGLECREELITFWRKNRSRYSEEKVFSNGTWEHHFQWKEALKRGVDVDAVRLKEKEAKIAKEAQLEAMKALVADLARAEVRVRASQIEATKAVVQDLPIDTHVVDNQGKGKAAVQDDGDDEWGELLIEGDSD